MAIAQPLREVVRARDQRRCAYCHTTEENCGLRMHIDHIVPESANGPTSAENLCAACFSCNIAKSAQQSAADPLTGERVALFHPLQQRWREHFAWDTSLTQIEGVTACGRATVQALQMNNPTVVQARRRWVSAGWHPPADDL